MRQEEANKENINCDEVINIIDKTDRKIEFFHKLMAHKRLILCTTFLAICYFVGVTWADNVVQNNGSLSSATMLTANESSIKSNSDAANSKNIAAPPKINTNPVKTATPNSTAPKCSCDGALIPRLAENDKELELCPECKCQHEARNTTLIKVVVIIVIWIISILVIYMLFLMCLDPLLNKRVDSNYQEHIEDDDTASVSPPLPNINHQDLYSRANVLNRVSHQQDKWKRQVREQRRHIYDRRTMLN